MNWKLTFQIIGLIAALLTLVPLIAADYWWIRIFDFPHLQFAGLTLLAIIIYFFTFNSKWINDYAYITILIACFAFQFSKFIDFTPFVGVEMNESTSNISQENTISVYAVNVLQKNKKNKNLFKEINSKQPDIIVFTETNQRWSDDIKSNIGENYPYKVEQPQDNTYGMLVYSKLKLVNPQVKFQVDPEIPSVHSKVEMKNGEMLQLYAIHPTPPMPQHNPMSTDRDQELMLTALESNRSELPVMVLGDFNDVAWSSSTQLTKTIGGLLDLRIGRGFYNTYHAQYFMLRWPLDHILVTSEFRLKDAGTGVNTGSDHFPSWATFTYEPELAHQQMPLTPDEHDWKQLEDQMTESGMEKMIDVPSMLQDAKKNFEN